MLEVVVAFLVFYLVVEPVLVGLHELGHALVPLARGRETVLFLGGEAGPTASLGPLTVTVQPGAFLVPVTYGATATDVETGRWTVLAGTLGGPLVSLLLAVGTGWLLLGRGLDGAPELVAFFAFLYLWFQTLFTLAPLRYPGWAGQYGDYRSDGRIALELLLGRDPTLDGDR